MLTKVLAAAAAVVALSFSGYSVYSVMNGKCPMTGASLSSGSCDSAATSCSVRTSCVESMTEFSAKSDCCLAKEECCEPTSACCAKSAVKATTDADCCEVGAPCCDAQKPCCAGTKATANVEVKSEVK